MSIIDVASVVEMDVDTVRRFRAASREVVRELELLRSCYGRSGASPQECHALMELERTPGLSPSALAERLRLDKTAVSRLLRSLEQKRWAKSDVAADDARRRGLRSTAAGRKAASRIHEEADARVIASLGVLSPREVEVVLEGMQLYARALVRSRVRDGYAIRPIEPADDAAVARIIRTVMPEFGACGPGYAIMDDEVDRMHETYALPRSAYFVLVHRRRVVGGAGVAPLAGGTRDTCELRKMYLLEEARGLGFGELLLGKCLDAARSFGFRRCYLETLEHMESAQRLYVRSGFRRLRRSKGDTGHFKCNRWYEKDLTRRSRGGKAVPEPPPPAACARTGGDCGAIRKRGG